jgi:hypothetical protein
MNPQKACRAWQKGKRVCKVCRFLVNKDGHEERYSIKGWKPPTKMETETPISTENRGNELPCPCKPELEDTITYTIHHQLVVIIITGPPDHEKLAINLSFY